MDETYVRIGIFGKEYLYSYHVANLTEDIIENAEKEGHKLLWVIPDFETKVHTHAAKWLDYRGQEVKRMDVNVMLEGIDMGLVFWDNINEGVLHAAREMARRKLPCHIVDDKPRMEITEW